jgi:hypothetical protein
MAPFVQPTVRVRYGLLGRLIYWLQNRRPARDFALYELLQRIWCSLGAVRNAGTELRHTLARVWRSLPS